MLANFITKQIVSLTFAMLISKHLSQPLRMLQHVSTWLLSTMDGLSQLSNLGKFALWFFPLNSCCVFFLLKSDSLELLYKLAFSFLNAFVSESSFHIKDCMELQSGAEKQIQG